MNSNLKVGDTVECFVGTNKKGVGFARSLDVKSKFVEKIEIKVGKLNKALPGDRCVIKVTGRNIVRGKDYGLVAEVLKVVERKQLVYAGHIVKDGNNFVFVSHDNRMYTPFSLPVKNLNGAEVDDKVIVSIESWESATSIPVGKVEKVLGKKGDSRAELAAFSEERGFQIGFPEAVEEESKKLHEKGIVEEDLKDRLDFREKCVFTIDPIDAKDFDDAISVEFLDNGEVEVGVHIADVSHYLRPGMAMDEEAMRRTTSVYLVDRVVPMLPEVLSNDLCSLVAGVNRLTMSAVFYFDQAGNLQDKKTKFGESVIFSKRRFAYEGAQHILENENFENLRADQGLEGELKIVSDDFTKFKKPLVFLNTLAKKLSKERKDRGAITMETEEVKFRLDENGVPVEVYRKVRKDAHKLVEEFMLLANIAVAEYIHNLGEKNHVGIYRVHDTPDPDKMLALSTFLYNLGYDAPYKDDTIAPKDLNKVMMELEDDPNKGTIQNQIIRSMQKAIYTTQNIGHYGLAFEYYTHFTSPIRRYPDVMIHRLMKKYLKGGTSDQKDVTWHEVMCLRSSEREKDAAEAERSSVKYKQVEYMSHHLGEELTAVVSGLSPFGVYLEDEYSKCEGMIKFMNMGDGREYFEFDDRQYVVKGDKGTIIRMGDVYKVKVKKADLEEKQIDYEIVSKVRSIEPRKRL
jgi:ribonuclease R